MSSSTNNPANSAGNRPRQQPPSQASNHPVQNSTTAMKRSNTTTNASLAQPSSTPSSSSSGSSTGSKFSSGLNSAWNMVKKGIEGSSSSNTSTSSSSSSNNQHTSSAASSGVTISVEEFQVLNQQILELKKAKYEQMQQIKSFEKQIANGNEMMKLQNEQMEALKLNLKNIYLEKEQLEKEKVELTNQLKDALKTNQEKTDEVERLKNQIELQQQTIQTLTISHDLIVSNAKTEASLSSSEKQNAEPNNDNMVTTGSSSEETTTTVVDQVPPTDNVQEVGMADQEPKNQASNEDGAVSTIADSSSTQHADLISKDKRITELENLNQQLNVQVSQQSHKIQQLQLVQQQFLQQTQQLQLQIQNHTLTIQQHNQKVQEHENLWKEEKNITTQLTKELSDTKEHLRTTTDELLQARYNLQAQATQIVQHEEKTKQLEKEKSILQTQLEECKIELDSFKIDLTTERNDHQKQIEQFKIENNIYKHQLEQSRSEFKHITTEMEQVQAQSQGWKEKFTKKQALVIDLQMKIQEKKEQTEQMMAQFEKVESQYKEKIANLDTQLFQSNQTKEHLKKECLELQRRIKHDYEPYHEKGKMYDETKKQLDQLKNDYLELERKYDTIKTKNIDLNVKNNSLEEQIAKHLEYISNLEQRSKDQHQEIKTLTKRNDKLHHSFEQLDRKFISFFVNDIFNNLYTTDFKSRYEAACETLSQLVHLQDEHETLKQKYQDEKLELQLQLKKLKNLNIDLKKQLEETIKVKNSTPSTPRGDFQEYAQSHPSPSAVSVNSSSPQLVEAPSAETEALLGQLQSDNAVLLERIGILQQTNWDLQEKLRLINDRQIVLVDDLEKKQSLLEYFYSQIPLGRFTSPEQENVNSKSLLSSFFSSSNSSKKEVSPHKASLSNQGLDPISLEAYHHMQRVMQDTLLHNITLQKHIEMLGEEVDRLSKKLANTSK
ncbi:hypothetical protein C9374_007940 [Naegleria lovaniensis]|uniref:Uncharacterized protein n=1 Tax=Naegleria lovaniensis TaxID=51637 RepID=A0AA88KG04_NAELO|nr:uncharacterized protein C9374_007940 [Naegleria lovaniensis]KAG2378792.1 hypothetical protein C9374_007940 [Naegleria lovaniensis]